MPVRYDQTGSSAECGKSKQTLRPASSSLFSTQHYRGRLASKNSSQNGTECRQQHKRELSLVTVPRGRANMTWRWNPHGSLAKRRRAGETGAGHRCPDRNQKQHSATRDRVVGLLPGLKGRSGGWQNDCCTFWVDHKRGVEAQLVVLNLPYGPLACNSVSFLVFLCSPESVRSLTVSPIRSFSCITKTALEGLLMNPSVPRSSIAKLSVFSVSLASVSRHVERH